MVLWSITTTACAEQKKKTSVGIVSPYAAQVISLQERVQSYEKHNFLSVEVLLIHVKVLRRTLSLSTYRQNNGGNIGFLDCVMRTNVALTRAK
jgi:superfamily I DNA and/or RNA helicase